MQLPQLRSRLRIDCAERGNESIRDTLLNGTPQWWRGNDLQLELGAFFGTQLLNPANWSSIKAEVFAGQRTVGAPLMTKTIGAGDINAGLTVEEWNSNDETKYHAKVEFTAAETVLSIPSGQNFGYFWLVISVITTSGKRLTLGGVNIQMIEDNTPQDAAGPVQGGNIIPGDAEYDGSGEYTLTVEADRMYSFTKGANDDSYDNGGGDITTDGNFTAASTSILLKGTPSEPVTAIVRADIYATVAELDERYLTPRIRWIVGGWLIGTSYLTGDTLYYAGSAWRAKRNNVGVTPVVGDDWEILAQAGEPAVVATTSTTSLAVGTGSKSFTTSDALDVLVGSFLVVARTSAPTSYMYGQVTAISGTSVTLNVSSIGGSGTHTDWSISLSGARPKTPIGVALTGTRSDVTTGTGKETIRMPLAMQLESVMATLTEPSTSGIVTVDINKNGTTILSTKLTIDVDEKTSATAAIAAVISDAVLAAGDEITFDVDVAGTGAKGLKVWMIGLA